MYCGAPFASKAVRLALASLPVRATAKHLADEMHLLTPGMGENDHMCPAVYESALSSVLWL